MTIVNHENYVSLEVAKLLKEAGFDLEVRTCRYNSSPDKVSSNGTLTSNFNGYAFQHIAVSAPTLDVAQKWLREVKHFEVYAMRDNFDSLFYYFAEAPNSEFGNRHWIECEDYSDTYEEALEAGIKKCLTILLEEKK